MKTTYIGQAAESAVADFLIKNGYKILDRNWRMRWCEVDIVAAKDKIIHFVEVKYRIRPAQGEGLEHITRAKLRQMTFAAEFWVSQNGWSGDWRLLGASVSGISPELIIDELVELS
jgi:uncharacterized protein (TIGR00252 family)